MFLSKNFTVSSGEICAKGRKQSKVRKIKILISWAIVSFSATQIFPQQIPSDGAIFGRILTSLKQKTKVPLRLPDYLATEEETYPLYAIVESVSRTRYNLELGFTPDCSGQACHYGTVSGEIIKSKFNHSGSKAVKMKQGSIGYFFEGTCGASCADSDLVWEQKGYRYTVSIKAGNVETLTKIANSAIENSDTANQSAANTVENFDVKFSPGKSQTVRRGKADYAMSYVYNLEVRKGQVITIKVESAEKELTFSFFLPSDADASEVGFGVKQWSGKTPQTGIHKIVLVMNNENASKVPYRLHIKVE